MTDSSDNNGGNSLETIRTAKTRLIVCFLTFPVYAWAITALLNRGNDITLLMILYMFIYAVFGINAAVKRCPECHEQFYVRKYFLNIFTTKCTHCGLSYFS